MANNTQVIENWISQKINRLYKTVEWRARNLKCDDDEILSYSSVVVAIRTNKFFKGKRVYFFNCTRFSSGTFNRGGGTSGHQWETRDAITRSNGLMISLNFYELREYGYHSGLYNENVIVDMNKKGEALLTLPSHQQSIYKDYILITENAMIRLKEPASDIAGAKKQITPSKLGKDYHQWRNYFFKPTGMHDKEFAKMNDLTQAQLGKWTSKADIEKPPDVKMGWRYITARVFGNSPLTRAFDHKASPAPYVTGVIYGDQQYHRTLYRTDGEWWKVMPMVCDGYIDKY